MSSVSESPSSELYITPAQGSMIVPMTGWFGSDVVSARPGKTIEISGPFESTRKGPSLSEIFVSTDNAAVIV